MYKWNPLFACSCEEEGITTRLVGDPMPKSGCFWWYLGLSYQETMFEIFMHNYRTICFSPYVDLDFSIGIIDDMVPNRPVDDYIRVRNACAIFTDGSKSVDSRFVRFYVFCRDCGVRFKGTLHSQVL